MLRAVLLLLLLLSGASRADVSAPDSLSAVEDAEVLRVARAFFDAAARDEWSAMDPVLPFRFCTMIEHSIGPDYKKCVRLRSRTALVAVREDLYPERPKTIELDVRARRATTGLVRDALELDRSMGVDSMPHSDERFVLGTFDPFYKAVTLVLRKHGNTFQVTGWLYYIYHCNEDPC
jgi:hypothetical protein